MERSRIYTGFPFILFYGLIYFFLLQHHYAVSKTVAENLAWKFTKENGIDLVTIHPGVVISPLLQPTLNGSVKLILNQINGIV